MASITLGGNPIHTNGELPKVGSKATDFNLVKTDLGTATLADFAGSRVVLNIFPSIDTGTCATSVRKFNETASTLENTVVLCISRDLPFAQKLFCATEGLENVINLSDFQDGSFGKELVAQAALCLCSLFFLLCKHDRNPLCPFLKRLCQGDCVPSV